MLETILLNPTPLIGGFPMRSQMTDLVALKTANAERWATAEILHSGFPSIARCLVEPGAKARYLLIESKTSVPWFVIAVIHEREASQRWDAQLGQGDPLGEVSRHVPIGRGPFKTWEDGAIDALVNCAPHAARWRDWSAGGALTLVEQYNGLGYAARGLPSPYLWSGTDQYHRGKFVRGGVFDPDAVDSQLGCAGLLRAMMALDPTIAFTDAAIAAPAPKPKPPPPSSTIKTPAEGSLGAFFVDLFKQLFRRK